VAEGQNCRRFGSENLDLDEIRLSTVGTLLYVPGLKIASGDSTLRIGPVG